MCSTKLKYHTSQKTKLKLIANQLTNLTRVNKKLKRYSKRKSIQTQMTLDHRLENMHANNPNSTTQCNHHKINHTNQNKMEIKQTPTQSLKVSTRSRTH